MRVHRWTARYVALGALTVPMLMGQLCLPGIGNILEGLDDELAEAEPISIFDGEWYSEEHQFALEITYRLGVVTLANSNARKVGETMLVILSVDDSGFSGRWMFQDGSIHDVTGEFVDENTLSMAGATWAWTLTRIRPATYALTIAVEGEGTVEPGSGTFDADEEVTLTVIPSDGWRFDHWEGDLTGGPYDHWRDYNLPPANPGTLAMDADRTVTAVFVPRRTETETFDLGGGITLTVIAIPGGTFTMGSSDEEQMRFFDGDGNPFSGEGPQHTVTVQTFAMGETEITRAQYRAVMGSIPPLPEECKFNCCELGDNRPVVYHSWLEAVAFCESLGIITGRFCRLPTEAEWEYACRAGTSTAFSTGDAEAGLADYAWYGESARECSHDVATKLPNPFGLYDMHGNVWEWIGDWIAAYPEGPQINPTGGLGAGSNKITRGGAYSRSAWALRSAYRYDFAGPDHREFNFGFRVVCE